MLFAVALGVLLAAGPIILWHRAERAVATLQIELRPSSHEVEVGGRRLAVGERCEQRAEDMRTDAARAPRRCVPPVTSRISPPRHRQTLLRRTTPAGSRRARGWRKRIARGVRVPALGPGERAELRFAIPTAERGVLTVPSLRLWCLDPFELFAYEMVVTTEASIVVVPDPTPPRGLVGGVLQPAGRLVWAPPQSGEASGGQGFDLSGLRPYVPGDRLRLLHWPTLARTGELLVRDFEGSGTDAVTLIMDDRADKIDPAHFEAIVSATAGIGSRGGPARSRSGVALAGRRVSRPASRATALEGAPSGSGHGRSGQVAPGTRRDRRLRSSKGRRPARATMRIRTASS